jgi:hypothetical protein
VLNGMLWFHGSSGLGKSTLALLLARSQGVAWRFADLRDLSASAIRAILIGIASSFRQTGASGLILDDVPAEPDNALISAIGQVARAVGDVDGVLVITSMKPPQPTLSGRLGLDSDSVIRVPYLTEEDVTDMVKSAGGDARKWARSIHAFAGGHPQLVDARVAGLKQRGWNEKEIFADIVPLPPTATHDEMMFIIRATALKSVEELVELIDALEQQPKAVRDRYLGAAARTNQSLHLIVAGSGLAEVKRPGFDARAAAATYHKLSQMKSARNNPDLSVELLCAEAIMLDEYADEKDGALEVLRIAQEA